MNAVTYGGTRIPTAVTERLQTGPGNSFFARFMHALRETRVREARRAIEKNAHLLESGNRNTKP